MLPPTQLYVERNGEIRESAKKRLFNSLFFVLNSLGNAPTTLH